MGGQGTGVLRAANRHLLVAQLRAGGPSSRAELARRSGLAKQTVSSIVGELLAEGVVREVGQSEPDLSGGRPAVLLEYAADRVLVAGLELGVSRTRVVLADALGQPLARSDVVALPGDLGRRDPERLLDAVVSALAEACRGRGGTAPLRALGVAVTGLVQPASGTCVLAPNLGWRDVPVADLLRRRLSALGLDVPVVVRGAAQACAIAEHREGAAAGEDDVVLLFEDEGVGAAVIEGGRLLDGSDGTAGELGHCLWPGADAPCGCGRRGCVEVVASGPAVRAAVEAAGGRPLDVPPGVPTLAALAERGGPDVEAAAKEAGRVLGTAASWLVAITAPRAVVLSGALVSAPPALLRELGEVLAERALPRGPLRVVAGHLGDDAALRGAVLLARDEAWAGAGPA